MVSNASVTRIALRHLRSLDTFFADDAELKQLADFMASQADSMDDASVCYGTYVCNAVPGVRQPIIKVLSPKLILSYRKRLVDWFQYALVKRANLGGGGKTIKMVEKGLAEWVEAIPAALMKGQAVQLSEILPDTEYFIPERLDPVGNKILKVIWQDAQAAGVVGRGKRLAKVLPFSVLARRLPLTVQWDADKKLWYVPYDRRTDKYVGELVMFGFQMNRSTRRWERKLRRLTPELERQFTVIHPEPPKPTPAAPTTSVPVKPEVVAPNKPEVPATPLSEWFFDTWLPVNLQRFTKVFSEYAKNAQSSYQLVFSASGKNVAVKFKRSITTPAQAVEELRYRYTGRHGREPWLEVMDKFVQLVATTSPSSLVHIIDRINNLQHSNGLFMEHFPSSVQSWYEKFLNAKYNTPYPDELAKFIPDRDLRDLLIAVAAKELGVSRGQDWKFEPPPAYDLMKKELADVGDAVNWRAKGYPRYKGTIQVDRFDDAIQDGLSTLRRLDSQREMLLSTQVADRQQHKKWQVDVMDWVDDWEKTKASMEKALAAQQKRELNRPGHAAEWEAVNFPKEFMKRFPFAAPGTSKSELAPYLVRYASEDDIADRYMTRLAARAS